MKCCFKPRSLAVIAMLLMSMAVVAVPAKRQWMEKTTTDGNVVRVQIVGDEFGHWYVDADGNTYTLTEDDLLASADAAALVERRSARAQKMTAARRAPARVLGDPSTHGEYIGAKKGLVILVNFKDVKMQSTSTQQAFADQFNQVGYNKNHHIGSVHDYFYDQSYGQFDLTFDVVGPVTISREMSYYGGNDRYGNDQHPGAMVGEAIKLADEYVDFRDYDWDGDGEVDQVFVVYAGYSEASGADDDTVWPHEWSLSDAKQYKDGPGILDLDGVRIDTYACSSELAGTDGSTMDGIGTACHEFSHCLGLPDFYDTKGNGCFGLDSWSLMDYGCYNGPNEDGSVPSGYTAYERWYSGWMTPTTLSETTTITGMKAITDAAEAYIVYNDANANEYYILQNIQQKSWNTYAYGHGMLVLHVNYVRDYWAGNTVNTSSSLQCCTIIPADNQFMTGRSAQGMYATASDLAGDPYPGTKNKSALTDKTTPAATLYNANTSGKKYMSKPIEDIAEVNGLIDFEFMKNGSGSGTSTKGEWALVDDASLLESGMEVVIACNTKGTTAGEVSSQVLVSCSDAVFSDDLSELTSMSSSTLVFTLGGTAGSWTLSDDYGNTLHNTAEKKLTMDERGYNAWKISIASNGNATIQCAKNSTWGTLQFNAGAPRFTTYKTTQTPVQLYCRKIVATGVKLNKSELSMQTGDEEELTATVIPANATAQGLVWSSSDTSVATVAAGTVKAVGEGTAVITVTTADGKISATCTVTVTLYPTYTVTLGDSNTSLTENVGREGVILPERTAEGYVFEGWSLENVIEATTTTPVIIAAGTYHPTADVTLYPVFSFTEGGGDAWQLVNDLSTVTDGEYALLSPNHYAFNGTISSGHGQHTSEAFVFDADGMATTAPSGTVVLTLTASGNGYTMYNEKSGYLYAKAAKSGNLAWHATESSYWYWNTDKSNWMYGSNSAYLRTYEDSFRTYGASNNTSLLMARKVTGASTVYASLLSEHSGILGDANDDGVVDVSDVTLVVAYVLGTVEEGSTFVFEQANAAGAEENTLDVSDITAIVAIILGGSVSE